MTMIQSEFRQLKQKIVAHVGKSGKHSELIEVFKEFYRDDIDSERKFEQIVTIGQLLKILETRDVLSENNVEPLTDIATRLKDNDLLRIICKYERNYATSGQANDYEVQHNSYTSPKETKFHSPFANLSPEKERRLENTLAKEIGTHWRDLARNLKIREGNIDKIDMASNNLEDKAREIFKQYKEDIADNTNRWFFVLCDALEKSRRRDLSKTLQEIMSMNIM